MKLHRQLNVRLAAIILLFMSCNQDEEDNALDNNSGGNGIGNNQASAEHSCGAPNVHNPNISYGTMTDQEGNTYKTVVIGEQEWMAENLNTSIYRNGDEITGNLSNAEWLMAGDNQQDAWAYYNNDSINECPYGRLYNWYSVSDPRNLCPTGWHVPTDEEWGQLIDLLDPTADGGNSWPNSAGGKLKSAGSQYWQSPNIEATNETGFSALPGGGRASYGSWASIGTINTGGQWWTATGNSPDYAINTDMVSDEGAANRAINHKGCGFAIRCIKD
jgi:uncharacterized protein (TIGR02145 family)